MFSFIKLWSEMNFSTILPVSFNPLVLGFCITEDLILIFLSMFSWKVTAWGQWQIWISNHNNSHPWLPSKIPWGVFKWCWFKTSRISLSEGGISTSLFYKISPGSSNIDAVLKPPDKWWFWTLGAHWDHLGNFNKSCSQRSWAFGKDHRW